jgi:hypothetical protein
MNTNLEIGCNLNSSTSNSRPFATCLRFAVAGCDISVTSVPGLNQPLIFRIFFARFRELSLVAFELMALSTRGHADSFGSGRI